MANWALKTEPAAYSFEDLVRQGRTVWDGVTNPQALANLRRMRPGDRVLIYHTGKLKAMVGTARVVSDPYPDPKKPGSSLFVVELEAGHALPEPVPLATLKREPLFADSPLVRQGRLSVVPLTSAQWDRVLALAKP